LLLKTLRKVSNLKQRSRRNNKQFKHNQITRKVKEVEKVAKRREDNKMMKRKNLKELPLRIKCK